MNQLRAIALAARRRRKAGLESLSAKDIADLNLADDQLYHGADKSAFIGRAAAEKIWFRANFRLDSIGFAQNKLAADSLFAAHGIPIPATNLLFHEDAGLPGPFLCRDLTDLVLFLRDPKHYPFFGKPLNGSQSIGAISAGRYEPHGDLVLLTNGHAIPLSEAAGFIWTHGRAGYLIQQRIIPHSFTRALCGQRLACVRMLTGRVNGSTQILRACWKIPGSINIADNFRHDGNLLAAFDLSDGRILRLTQRLGETLVDVSTHPETGAALIGAQVPNWSAVRALALAASTVDDGLSLVGWDIAPTDQGAILIELNHTPDFNLHQIADRRGMMDALFRDYLTRCDEAARTRAAEVRAHRLAQLGKSLLSG
jgi:hypothetical protein